MRTCVNTSALSLTSTAAPEGEGRFLRLLQNIPGTGTAAFRAIEQCCARQYATRDKLLASLGNGPRAERTRGEVLREAAKLPSKSSETCPGQKRRREIHLGGEG